MIRPFKLEDLDTVMQIWLGTNISAHPFIAASYWHGIMTWLKRCYHKRNSMFA